MTYRNLLRKLQEIPEERLDYTAIIVDGEYETKTADYNTLRAFDLIYRKDNTVAILTLQSFAPYIR